MSSRPKHPSPRPTTSTSKPVRKHDGLSARQRRVEPCDDRERAVVEAALNAYRVAQQKFRSARDPIASMDAYDATFRAGDAVTQCIAELAQASSDEDEEPDEWKQPDEKVWVKAVRASRTYMTRRGPVRVLRWLYREQGVRNGPTRCLFEEMRGIVEGGFTPELGRAVVAAVSHMPAAAAERVLRDATGYAFSPATMKRTTTSVGGHMRTDEQAVFDAVWSKRPIPEAARTVVISVDGLSIHLRDEGYKQCTAATISLLDELGERMCTVRLGELPEAGKATIMQRVEREVRALLMMRPTLTTEVVIDGAHDLRDHLIERFPFARHVTDFFHALEHLGAALRNLFPFDDARRASHMRYWAHYLKHRPGTVDELRAWLDQQLEASAESLGAWAKREVEKHREYFYNQREFMDYPDAMNDNAAIGSGLVEAACKTIFTQRLKVSGARWSRNGARAIGYIRSVTQSDRFADAFAHHLCHPEVRWRRELDAKRTAQAA